MEEQDDVEDFQLSELEVTFSFEGFSCSHEFDYFWIEVGVCVVADLNHIL